MDIYREHILDHAHQPRGWGKLLHPTGQADVHNPLCGDRLTVTVQCTNAQVIAMGFTGEGCVISRACASLLSEEIVGKNIEDILTWSQTTIENLLGVPLLPARISCGLLALRGVHEALNTATHA